MQRWAKQRHAVQYNALYMGDEVDHKNVKFYPNFSSNNQGFQSLLPDLPKGFIFGLSPEEQAELESMCSR